MRNLLANLRDLARSATDEALAHLPGAPVIDLLGYCVVPGRAHRATDGLLCRDHLEELGTWLHDIEDEARRLSAAPPIEMRWDRGGGSLASQQSPVVLDAVVASDDRSSAHGHLHRGPVCEPCAALSPQLLHLPQPTRTNAALAYGVHLSCLDIVADRDEHDARAERLLAVLPVLHGWADQARADFLLSQPARTFVDCVDRARFGGPLHGPAYGLPCRHPTCSGATWERTVPEPPTIRGERKLLTDQLARIAGREWVRDMYLELAELRRQLMRTNRNEDERPLRGRCPRPVDEHGTECGGELHYEYPPIHSTSSNGGVDDSPWRPRAVVCQRNTSHRWEGRNELARLSSILGRQQGTVVDVEETPARPGRWRPS